jgi:uncharacterized protein YutE (UPF0331/DUF86 family)
MALARIKGAEADLGQRKQLHLIVVVTDQEQVPASAKGFPVLTRSNKLTDDSDGFIADLNGILRRIAAETGIERQAEPKRLFDAKEYRAAVISAMTLLEATLRERLNKSPWPKVRRPMSMRSLIDHAVEQNIIQPVLRTQIDSWIRLRNEVVHSSIAIGKAQAREMIDGVLALLGQL